MDSGALTSNIESTPAPAPYTTPGGTPIRGRAPTLQDQTNAALTVQAPNIIKSPTFVKSGAVVGTKQYLDQWGRISVGNVDINGSIIRDDTFTATPTPTFTPTPIPTGTPSPTTLTNTTAAPPDDNSLKNNLSLNNLSGLLGVAGLAYGAYNIAGDLTSSIVSGSGLINGVNNVASNAIPGFSGPNTSFGVGQTTFTKALGYGTTGGFVANLFGLTTGSPVGDLAAGALGGVAGGAIGGSIGGTILGIGAGAAGAFIGGFVVTALASLFAGKPSEKLAYGNYDTSTGQSTNGSYQGPKYSSQNNTAVSTLLSATSTLKTNLESNLGATVKMDGGISYGVDSRHGITVQAAGLAGLNVDAPQGTYTIAKNGLDAVNAAGKYMLINSTFKNDDAQYAKEQLTANHGASWDGMNFDQATGSISFANDFAKTANNFINGNFNIDQGKQDALMTIDTWAQTSKNLFAGDKADVYGSTADRAATAARAKIIEYYNSHADPGPKQATQPQIPDNTSGIM